MFLIRQYIYELLHYLVYDRYGVGWLKKKYSKDVRDRFGNSKPPLLYTAMAPDAPTRDVIESPLFRFFYEINGKAASGKSVYRKRSNIEKQPSVDHESLLDAEQCEQYWEEISTNLLNLEVLAEYVPHMRLFIGDTSVIRRANLLSLSMPDYLSFAFCCLFGIPICRNFQPCSHL